MYKFEIKYAKTHETKKEIELLLNHLDVVMVK